MVKTPQEQNNRALEPGEVAVVDHPYGERDLLRFASDHEVYGFITNPNDQGLMPTAGLDFVYSNVRPVKSIRFIVEI